MLIALSCLCTVDQDVQVEIMVKCIDQSAFTASGQLQWPQGTFITM